MRFYELCKGSLFWEMSGLVDKVILRGVGGSSLVDKDPLFWGEWYSLSFWLLWLLLRN